MYYSYPEFCIRKKDNREDDNKKSKKDEDIIEINSDSDDETNNEDSIKNLIKFAKSSGSSSVGGESKGLPQIPGLVVKGYGHLSFPMNELQANKLIEIFKPAPYGFGYHTLVNKTVRDTYQLEPSEFEIKNEEWNTNLNDLVKKVGDELGCKGGIEAKLYKLLLYKQGSHFKKHVDTEKDVGMFGTLIIQLPSIYTGGELIVHGKTCRKVYDFSQTSTNGKSAYSVYYAAHYADLEHELLEVKSGYRMVLIYNLCWKNGNGISNNNEKSVEAMTKCLNELKKSPVALFLEHKYTEESLETNGIKALKGIDNDRYNLLKNASDKLPADKQFDFYVVRGALEIEDAPDADMVIDRSTKIENIFNSNGHDYTLNRYSFRPVNLDFFQLIIDPNQRINHQVDLDDSDEWGNDVEVEQEEYTGNAAGTRTTTYHKCFLGFWHKQYKPEFLR